LAEIALYEYTEMADEKRALADERRALAVEGKVFQR
jgi:hypothetical protein